MILNTRILISLVSIISMAGLLVGGTYAFFSTSVTSNDSTFSTGVMDLEIRDDNEGFTDAVTASTVATNMVPGGEVTESFICFRNTGDYDIQEIILSMSATGNVNALAPWVNTTKVELGFVDPGECADFEGGSDEMIDFTSLHLERFDQSTEGNNDGVVSLEEALIQVNGDDRIFDDLLNRPEAFLPADPNVLLKFRTTWQLSADAPNSAQGKSVTVDTTYVGNQAEVDEDSGGVPFIPTPTPS